MEPGKSLAERCAGIELFVLDVDGVLTDGGITYSASGEELKTFHVRDGSAIKLWQRAGKRLAIISGRTARAVDVRAAELGITLVFQGATDKPGVFGRLLAETGLRRDQAACVGDDLADLGLLQNCGLAVAVADACHEVIAAAHHVTQKLGGRGAVREAIELVLRCQDKWQVMIEHGRGEAQVA